MYFSFPFFSLILFASWAKGGRGQAEAAPPSQTPSPACTPTLSLPPFPLSLSMLHLQSVQFLSRMLSMALFFPSLIILRSMRMTPADPFTSQDGSHQLQPLRGGCP
jgi:hypothetical protein